MQNLHELLYSWEALKSHTCQRVTSPEEEEALGEVTSLE